MSDAQAASQAASRFAAGERATLLAPIGSGHIHASYRASFAARPALLLQEINQGVFSDVSGLMRNVELVTDHLRNALHARGIAGADLPRRVLCVARDAAGASWIRDAEGRAWRGFEFIEHTRVHEVIRDDVVAERGARAFGEFAADLAALEPAALIEILPGFHDTAARLDALAVLAEDAPRAARDRVVPECARALRLGREIVQAVRAGGGEDLPVRVVHNDCKIHNLLFDAASDAPSCVVDLDTVMPGNLLYDFGELVRTSVCEAPEDEEDLARIGVEGGRFEALARGYLRGLGAAVEPSEVVLLQLAGPLMAIENAVRFLADHIEGDRYFPAHRPGHNRIRGRAQLALAERLWETRETFAGVARRAAADLRA